jgi:hypothetical protein
MMGGQEDTIDFIVIGAQKAGTTTLFEHLKRHPEVVVPPDKEAPYFSHDRLWSKRWDNYLRQTFPARKGAGQKWGTVTPTYMVGGVYEIDYESTDAGHDYDERTVPLRIRERLPDVRLVAVLRDPVERAFSHYQMAVLWGHEQRGFDEAIDELLEPEALERSRKQPEETTGYITWGEYGRILAGYFAVFDAAQIHVTFTAELARTPLQLLHRVYGFLGVAPDFIPPNLGARYREGGVSRRYSWLNPHAVQEAVTRNAATRSLWHRLPDSSRQRIDLRFRAISHNVELWNRRGRVDAAAQDLTTLSRLRAHFVRDMDLIALLTGTEPPWWTAVHTP